MTAPHACRPPGCLVCRASDLANYLATGRTALAATLSRGLDAAIAEALRQAELRGRAHREMIGGRLPPERVEGRF